MAWPSFDPPFLKIRSNISVAMKPYMILHLDLKVNDFISLNNIISLKKVINCIIIVFLYS